jgi:colanic acid biosynthesis glycosyl transferase WcaI
VTKPPVVHILTQYLWPDDAPTGIYAEHVADALAKEGIQVRLVAGTGRYRAGCRPPPRTPIERLVHWEGRRESLASVAFEYESVRRAFGRYLKTQVGTKDVVILTSAPPTTLFLHRAIKKRGAIGVYWLQDYYPQLIRAVWDPPLPLRVAMRRSWDRHLRRWDHVVKVAANVRCPRADAIVIRNWNTVELGDPQPARPRTALYSGNLGWGHHIPSFLALCRRLVDEGYEVTVRGDGPGMKGLPGWVRSEAPLTDPEALVRSYWEAEVHLVAGHPELPDAVFPSKVWNALAAGRPVLASGFSGPMLQELEEARRAELRSHIGAWVSLVASLLSPSAEGHAA